MTGVQTCALPIFYDKFGYYAPAFGTGVAFNVANLSLLAMLVLRQHMINKERAMA